MYLIKLKIRQGVLDYFEEIRILYFIDSNAESPCLYFISLMGAPVEIVHGDVSVENLKDRCISAWSKHFKVVQVQKPPPTSAPAEPQPPLSSASVIDNTQPVPGSSQPAGGRSRENTPAEEIQAEDPANLTLDQKIERARQLAAAKAKLKMEEEAEVVFTSSCKTFNTS